MLIPAILFASLAPLLHRISDDRTLVMLLLIESFMPTANSAVLVAQLVGQCTCNPAHSRYGRNATLELSNTFNRPHTSTATSISTQHNFRLIIAVCLSTTGHRAAAEAMSLAIFLQASAAQRHTTMVYFTTTSMYMRESFQSSDHQKLTLPPQYTWNILQY